MYSNNSFYFIILHLCFYGTVSLVSMSTEACARRPSESIKEDHMAKKAKKAKKTVKAATKKAAKKTSKKKK